MINFFRKTRKKLADDNRFFKYWRYAIGEILLVVIGILIALSINNWNENRKNNELENDLSTKLYNELLRNKEYSEKILNSLDFQYSLIEPIVSHGPGLNVDSLIQVSTNHSFVRSFSLINYIASYTVFYDLDFKYYKAAINDGSISLLKNKAFAMQLEQVYINGPAMLDRIYLKEMNLNNDLHKYISENYGELLLTNETLNNGNWNYEMTKKILLICANDGVIRYKLQQKITFIKSKRRLLNDEIVSRFNIVKEAFNDGSITF